MQSIISLKDIRRSFFSEHGGTTEVLKGIDLEIEPGSFNVIRGESGSGKTTLLRILGLLDSGFEGDYALAGVGIGGRPDWWLDEMRAANIGFIFQDGRLFEHMNLKDNIALPIRLKGDSGHAEAVEALGPRFFSGRELGEQILTALPKTCSGGQKQRGAIMRSIVHNPSLILADEPTASLDKARKGEVLELLKELTRLGHTVVVVSHDEVFHNQGRQLEMVEGRLIDHGEETPLAQEIEGHDIAEAREPILPSEGGKILWGWRPRAPFAMVSSQALRETFQRWLFLALILSALIVGVTQISVFSSVIRGAEELVDQSFRQGSRLNRLETKPRRADMREGTEFSDLGEIRDLPAVMAAVLRFEFLPKFPDPETGSLITFLAMGLHENDPEFGLFTFLAGGPFTPGNDRLEVIVTPQLIGQVFDLEEMGFGAGKDIDYNAFIGEKMTAYFARFTPTKDPLEPQPVDLTIVGVILNPEGARKLYMPHVTGVALQTITRDREGRMPKIVTDDGTDWALWPVLLRPIVDQVPPTKLHVYTTGIREILPVLEDLIRNKKYPAESDIWDYKWALDIEEIAWRIFTPLLILIVVAVALTLVTNIFTSAKLREREFALWRVLGMRRGDLALMQVLASVIAIVIGSVIGLALAWTVVDQVQGFLRVEYEEEGFDKIFAPVSDFFGIILAGALVLGTLAALLPAMRTARVDPARVLQS